MEESRKSNITIAIHGMYDNYPIVITFTGSPAQIPIAVRRLQELGITTPLMKAAKKKEPPLVIDGKLCCPIHHKPLRQGRFGLYCTAPGDGKNGYCTYTWKEKKEGTS